MTSGGRNRKPVAVRARALRLIRDGFTRRQVATQLGISDNTVWRWMREGEPKPEPQNAPEAIRMLHAWPSGMAIVTFD